MSADLAEHADEKSEIVGPSTLELIDGRSWQVFRVHSRFARRSSSIPTLAADGVSEMFLLSDNVKPIFPGHVLGDRYVVGHELGRGGMGAVYAVVDRLLGERVALKVLLTTSDAPQSGKLERLRREVRLARLVAHPNVCRVYDLQVLDGHACLTMS